LTIAVVGAVVLSRRAESPIDLEEFPEGTAADEMAARRAAGEPVSDGRDGVEDTGGATALGEGTD
jgi:hypothetical protein